MPKVKKGPLGKAEVFYIDGNYRDLTAVEIAQDLNRSITSIENYIKKNLSRKNTGGIQAGDHFIRQRGVTIMSENASTIADQKRKSGSPYKKGCTTRIKED